MNKFKKKLSIITVTYNNENSIAEYLDSLTKYLPQNSEIIILDNNSLDQTLQIIKRYPEVKLIENRTNVGFSKGCNLVVQQAQGEFLLFLNPDIKVVDNAIEKMLKYIETEQNIGILAPQLVKIDGNIQASVRNLPTLKGMLAEYYFGIRDSYDEYVPQTKTSVKVGAVYGAAMLIRRKIFDSVGGFSEKYFLYYEDIDLCKKLQDQGKEIIYYPEAKFIHRVGGSLVHSEKLPFIVRTLTWFIPIKASGKYYYQVKGFYLYHGFIKGFIMSLLIYIAQKVRIYEK